MKTDLKLFAVLLGGSARGAMVELHDMTFVAAPTIEAAYPQLKEKWFGTRSSCHVDSWMELNQIDGYDVTLVPEAQATPPLPGSPQLFFVNVGSYPKGRLEESHTYLFLVGNDAKAVKNRATKLGPDGHFLPHKDNLEIVDQIIAVDSVSGYRIRLTQNAYVHVENPIQSDYRPL